MSAQEYAISHWPDTDELIAKAKRLVDSPVRPIRRDKMKEYLDYFETRCKKSKAATAEAARYIPGGVQHNLAFNHPFPLSIARADGAYLWDVDGNRYIDYRLGLGPVILGHGHPTVVGRVAEAIHSGNIFALTHEWEVKVAERIVQMCPGVDKVRFANSGGEGEV